jgi:ABC-type Fe3+-siderophore transport system permease subunit
MTVTLRVIPAPGSKHHQGMADTRGNKMRKSRIIAAAAAVLGIAALLVVAGNVGWWRA